MKFKAIKQCYQKVCSIRRVHIMLLITCICSSETKRFWENILLKLAIGLRIHIIASNIF